MWKLMVAMAAVLTFAAACGDDSVSLADAVNAADDGGGGDGDGGGISDIGNNDSDDNGGDDGGGAGAGSNTDFCRFNENINGGIDELDVFGDGATLEDTFKQVVDNIDRATSIAPGEIRGDVAILSEGFKAFAEILEEYDWNIFAIPDDVGDDPRLAALEDPRYEEAADRVNAFCGIEDPDPVVGGDAGTDDGDSGSDDDGGSVIPDGQRDLMIQTMQQAFGWDEDLASCVVDTLGLDDPTSINPAAFGEAAGTEICGRSFDELFAG